MKKEVEYGDPEAAQRLKLIRTELRLSQKQVSEGSNVFQAQLSSVESGNASIPTRLLYYFGKKHKVNLNWVVTGEGSRFVDASVKVENDEGEMTFSEMQRAIRAIQAELRELKKG